MNNNFLKEFELNTLSNFKIIENNNIYPQLEAEDIDIFKERKRKERELLKKAILSFLTKTKDFKQFLEKEAYYERWYVVRNIRGIFKFRISPYEDFRDFRIEADIYLHTPYEGGCRLLDGWEGEQEIEIMLCSFSETEELAEAFGLHLCRTCGKVFAYGGSTDSGRCYCRKCTAKHLDKKYENWQVMFARDQSFNKKIIGVTREGILALDNRTLI